MTDEQGGVVAHLAELERVAHEQTHRLDDCRTKGRLRAELWTRAYAAEFTGLRLNGEVRDHQDADHARQVARNIADAVAEDFDHYCREHRL
jgi:hypothetical protein